MVENFSTKTIKHFIESKINKINLNSLNSPKTVVTVFQLQK